MVVSLIEKWISFLWAGSPMRLIVEIGLVAFIIILLLRPAEVIPDPSAQLSKEDEDQIISEWKPHPIVPEITKDHDQSILKSHVVSSGPSDKITVDGKEVLNFGVANFLGFGMNKEIIDSALEAIDKYAVGACGPRQFYGTMDAHLNLESALAKFFGTEDSVNYCYPFATTTSVVQALIHNSDVTFIDEGCWYAAKLGAELTRGRVIKFKHNNMADLREKVLQERSQNKRWAKCNRWVVVEGIYLNDGEILDLPALMNIRKDFCLRTIIDETYSFGVLGKTGRGVLEHFNVPRDQVEASIGSLGPAFASLGGFTVGSQELSSFQRLSSFAYIFSASPPCFNAVAATKAIQLLSNAPEAKIDKLRANTQQARRELIGVKGFDILGNEISPIIHLRLSEMKPICEENILLEKIVNKAIEEGVAITKAKYVDTKQPGMRPTLKLFVSEAHSQEQITSAITKIKDTISSILN